MRFFLPLLSPSRLGRGIQQQPTPPAVLRLFDVPLYQNIDSLSEQDDWVLATGSRCPSERERPASGERNWQLSSAEGCDMRWKKPPSDGDGARRGAQRRPVPYILHSTHCVNCLQYTGGFRLRCRTSWRAVGSLNRQRCQWRRGTACRFGVHLHIMYVPLIFGSPEVIRLQ
ncbi:hypothetical protein BC628DRAFT_1083275 [Trametes gibbosa]|nr:hypothetical protein BC628DRAFT_1083275 [Trametes gibbosa]